MPKRICGCKDDTISTKKSLLKKYKESRVEDDGRTIYIGVVFHICFQNYSVPDIELDVAYTIEGLNKDFNKTCSNFNYGSDKYTDPSLKETYDTYLLLADKCDITFYKVDIRYNALPAQTSSNISVLDRNIKGSQPPINPASYLNIWVSEFNNGLLGYAQFPWENSPSTDGVIISSGTFGRNPGYTEYNLGKTLTHEIGHWLGLYHVFQETFAYGGGNIDYADGNLDQEAQEIKGDCVVDTPPQRDPTYGNPFNNTNSWPSSMPFDEKHAHRHMFMNYMDYSDDIALFMFTHDQRTKIRQLVHIYKPSILQNKPPEEIPPDPQVPPPEPQVPAPEPPRTTNYDFETDDPTGWQSKLLFYQNYSKSDGHLTILNAHSGSRCLRTRKRARAELQIDLDGVSDAELSVFVRANNPNTYVWVKPPNGSWFQGKIPRSGYYQQHFFSLPKPYESYKNNYYRIRVGTDGQSLIYSYFDDISITSVRSGNVAPHLKYLPFQKKKTLKSILIKHATSFRNWFVGGDNLENSTT